MATKPADIYQIKVTLNDIRPPIWRGILVSSNTNLHKLHDILQIVMGWHDSHLHQFTISGEHYGDPENDEGGEFGIQPEARFKLSQVVQGAGSRFQYEYDFGDGWHHTVLVESVQPPQPGEHYPRCMNGKRACPPEDIGGAWGYPQFLEAIADPGHSEHDETLMWVGGEFDPEAFDLEEVNASLRRMGRGRSAESSKTWWVEAGQPEENQVDLHSSWPQALSDDQRVVAEDLTLRRDMVTLLTYLRDNRVTGTPATGNLPLKAVREICARFVDPPKLEEVIGDRVFRVRSETGVRPLYFVHVLASVAGLVTGGPGRRWRLTPPAERFLSAPAPLQVWLMFATWWTQVNWAIAWPYELGPGYLSAGFRQVVLQRLLAQPAGEMVSFEPFADRLIEDAGWVWPIPDQDSAHTILHGIVERVVITSLRAFGILAAEYRPHRTLGPDYQELTAFRIIPFGQGLLAAIGKATGENQP